MKDAFFKKNIYLLTWLPGILVVAHRVFTVSCKSFHCNARALWLWRRDSRVCRLAVAARGLSCSASPTRDGTCTPILQDRFLTTGPPGKSQGCFLSLRWMKGVENKWGSPELWGEEKGSQVGWYLTCCWDHLPRRAGGGGGLTKALANQTLVKGLELSCCASSVSSLTVNHHSSLRS